LLRISGWSVTDQQHTIIDNGQHKYSDIVLQKHDHEPIVLELLATEEESLIKDHIDKTPTYMNTLSAVEVWVIHFTCEDNFIPVWQTSAQRKRGVNVVHVIHGMDFKNVTFHMYTISLQRASYVYSIFSQVEDCANVFSFKKCPE